MQLRSSSRLPLIGVFAIVYIIAGKIGLNLASLHANASPVWPPAGIALAAIVLLGYRAWPEIFVGAFIVNLTTAGGIATSVAIATSNTIEAIAGAWLVNRFAGGKSVFDSPMFRGLRSAALAITVTSNEVCRPAFPSISSNPSSSTTSKLPSSGRLARRDISVAPSISLAETSS